jgi:hypothetical protein
MKIWSANCLVFDPTAPRRKKVQSGKNLFRKGGSNYQKAAAECYKMAMHTQAMELNELKLALQQLESAVQEPRDEPNSVELVLDAFPKTFIHLVSIIGSELENLGTDCKSLLSAVTAAHERGWLSGELSLWLRLVTDYDVLQHDSISEKVARSIAQDVRACSCLFWQTYELLNAKFRWQTQVSPALRTTASSFSDRFPSIHLSYGA